MPSQSKTEATILVQINLRKVKIQLSSPGSMNNIDSFD